MFAAVISLILAILEAAGIDWLQYQRQIIIVNFAFPLKNPSRIGLEGPDPRRQRIHALRRRGPAGAEAHRTPLLVHPLPPLEGELPLQTLDLTLRQDGELLVRGGVDEQGETPLQKGGADSHSLLVGVPGDLEVEAVLKERFELDAQEPARRQIGRASCRERV